MSASLCWDISQSLISSPEYEASWDHAVSVIIIYFVCAIETIFHVLIKVGQSVCLLDIWDKFEI